MAPKPSTPSFPLSFPSQNHSKPSSLSNTTPVPLLYGNPLNPRENHIYQALLKGGLITNRGVGTMSPSRCSQLFSDSHALGIFSYCFIGDPTIHIIYNPNAHNWLLMGTTLEIVPRHIKTTGPLGPEIRIAMVESPPSTIYVKNVKDLDGNEHLKFIRDYSFPQLQDLTLKERHIFSALQKVGFGLDGNFYGMSFRCLADYFIDIYSNDTYLLYKDPSIHIFETSPQQWNVMKYKENGHYEPIIDIKPDLEAGGLLFLS
ncbi:MAG: hypothetical protein JSS34_03110 [Proteobacteria bacterium]|nr:hypothetical protein [Pseudomonadota bacterium]